MSDPREPTERDRYWLDHEAAVESSGQTAKSYAAEHGLSLHALYQARKRLRGLGFLPPGKTRAIQPKAKSPAAFSKVEVLTPRLPGSDFRLGLPNGLTFEWSGAELPSPVIDLLEHLIRLR